MGILYSRALDYWGVVMQQNVAATVELSAIFQNTEVVFIAIPSTFIQRTLQPLRGQIAPEIVLVNMAKGIDGATGLTSFQTLSGMFPDNPRVMLSGPSIANEFAHRLPTVVVIAGQNKSDLMRVARVLDNDYFRTRFSDDEIGVELGGILKNIYAIGLGLFDGENIASVNFRSVYLTLAIEVFIMALFALSFNLMFGYAGMLSFGQAVFYGIGAYTTALVLKHVTPSLGVALLSCIVVSFLSALVIGIAVAIIAGIFAGAGISQFRRTKLKPEATIRSLQEDREWLKKIT